MENNNTQHELFKPRWWRNVEVTPSCWYWKGYCTPKGYGRVKAPYPEKKKTVIVHRYVYELLAGSIPKGLHLDHKFSTQGCVRNCVNPKHLSPVTPKQNTENTKATSSRNKTGVKNIRVAPNGKYKVVVHSKGKYYYYGGTHEELDNAKNAAIELRNRVFTNNLEDNLFASTPPTHPPYRQPEENKA